MLISAKRPMTTIYAHGTVVSVEKSKAELDALLGKHGATSRGVMSNDTEGLVYVFFEIAGSKYQISVPLPKLGDFPSKNSQPPGWWGWTDGRRAEWRYKSWEQACRERWRAVVLMVKSKLEIVRIGMSTVQREFLSDLVLKNGRTVSEMIAGDPDRLLPAAGETG
jgi:hypothetical protein